MAASTETEQQLSLKLLVSKESNKVIFAEAGKDFVDVLCSFLTLPLATIVRHVEKASNLEPVTVGSLNSLYHSVEKLKEECFLGVTFKQMLLTPHNPSEDYCNTLKIKIDDEPTKYFPCSNHGCSRVSISPNKTCTSCRNFIANPFILKHFSKGFVSSVATFLITDELIVKPTDNVNLDVLHYFAIKGTSSVIEFTVDVTKEKVLDLLKCALLSKSPLTDLFIGQKPYLEKPRFSSCDFENTTDIKIELKLFIRKTDFKILFALGNEDFANLILSFLTFPLGGVVSKLGQKCSFGSIDGLHKSIADFDEKRYFLSIKAKNRLLSPPLPPLCNFLKQILPIQEESLPFCCYSQQENYKESFIYNDILSGDDISSYCKSMRLVKPELLSDEVYVKSPGTYVVTDDLVISPASPISALDLINNLGTPLEVLEEKVVTIGYKECFNILKASLTSTSALTAGLSHLLP